jgi:hypothetical protein
LTPRLSAAATSGGDCSGLKNALLSWQCWLEVYLENLGQGDEEWRGMPRYWFPAKRYGWGWGPPTTWEGWAALAVFVGLIVVGAFLFPPNRALPRYLGYVLVLAIALIGLCWLKGEPPRWRWGDNE